MIVAIGFGLFHIARARCFQLVGDLTCRVETGEKLVSLTFDDGPTPGGLDAILPVLDQYNVKATFFVVGGEMERWPEQTRRLVRAGHELGNHTFSHRRMVLRLPGTYAGEIGRTDELLRAAGEKRPHLLRPPYGKRLIGFPLAARRAGYRLITWDVEEDASQKTPQLYARQITGSVKPGSIVLMHPMYGNRDLVAAALPIIIENLQARGYRFVTVSELLGAEPD